MKQSRKNRRGVILLISLSLLILFLLIGITYVLSSGQFKQAAKTAARVEQYDDIPKDTLNKVILEIIRGSNNPRSSIAAHSILEGGYGDYAAKGAVTTFAPDNPSKSQFYNLSANLTLNPVLASLPKYAGAKNPGFFNGCVLTITSKQGTGASARIISSNYTGGTANFTIMPLDSDLPLKDADVVGANVLINGRQFSGTGPGFDEKTGQLSKKDSANNPLALLPNVTATPNYLTTATLGGMNADYTAADHNSMYVSYTPATNGLPTIPSYHRPALINYWMNNGGNGFMNKFMLRPNVTDNPVFGKTVNPSFDPVRGPWDVDNDGDGVPDSVWIDIGLPTITTKDGRVCKQLVAVLVRDLDGRLNINAHGNLAHVSIPTPPPSSPGNLGNQQPTPFPRGLGIGPAEVNVLGVLSKPEEGVLFGKTGRYGPDASPGQASAKLYDTTNVAPFKFWDYPADFYNTATTVGNFPSANGTPPDLDGRGYMALDLRGQPLYFNMGAAFDKDIYPTNPYRVNFAANAGRIGDSKNATVDNLVTPGELETLLRAYDIDMLSMPNRLIDANGIKGTGSNILQSLLTKSGLGVGEDRRNLITSDSFHVPVPSPVPTTDMRNKKIYQVDNIAELLRAKLQNSGFTGNLDNEVVKLLPHELMEGLPFDISRPTGIQRDDPSGVMAKGSPYAPQLEARYLYTLMMMFADPPAAANAIQLQMRSRRIAQWAINAVAFKDPSPTMIPFVFHPDIFTGTYKGWTTTGNPSDAATPSASIQIVWSTKTPELLLHEAIVTHDRRVADTDEDKNLREPSDKNPKTTPSKTNNDGKAPHAADSDLDQVRVPQGSGFFKLYCPTSQANLTKATLTLKDMYKVETSSGKVVLNLEKVAGTDPVWRLAISSTTKLDLNSQVAQRLNTLGVNSDQISLDPDNMTVIPGSAQANVKIERYVTFATTKPASAGATADNSYYSRNAAGTAVVEPGGFAVVGPRVRTYFGANGPHIHGKTTSPATDRLITLTPTSVTVNGTASKGTLVRGIICGMDPATGFNTPYIGLNLSEPLRTAYYAAPTHVWKTWQDEYKTAGVAGYMDAYGDGTANTYLDNPEEGSKTKKGDLFANGALATGTYNQYRTVFLQRLADPNTAYNKVTNPYITVDWMPVDLTVFNGEDQMPTPFMGTGKWDADDPTAPDVSKVAFTTRQRGMNTNAVKGLYGGAKGAGLNGLSLNNEPSSLWPALSDDPNPTDASNTHTPPDATHNFSCKLKNSLTGLNSTYGAANATAGYEGSPSAKPFPWMTWNNRPYVNAYELMMVPASSPSRLTTEFSLPTMLTTYSGPYKTAGYGHLLDFFYTQQATATSAGAIYRVFDYLGVPSKFVGTETWLEPTTFKNDPVFKPPFNSVSNYREAGRININTVNSRGVWDAILNGMPAPDFAKFLKSRGGYDSGPNGTELFDSKIPTSFAGVFRSAVSADLPQPVATLQKTPAIEATLLRSDPDAGAVGRPLFAPVVKQGAESDLGLRHPYFTQQGIDRLENIFTTRSNVFAVWVTVGYFEVLPQVADVNHPDGYALGAEIGSETGDVKRHRAFFMIDRSIPVGFERGQDHNVHKALIVGPRYIE